jgi:hypothetical protein
MVVAGPELALGEDAQVGAGTAGVREQLDHLRVAEPQAELEARLPGLADLELDGPDPPALADHGICDIDALEREVLAEHARPEVTGQPRRPPGGVLGGIRVDRLVGAAVDAPVGLVIAIDVHARDPDAAVHRRLADRAHDGPAAPHADLLGAADVEGHDAHRIGR